MKIAIVGSSPSSSHLAPYKDSEWKIWGIGTWAKSYERVELLFEIHDHMEASIVGSDYHTGLVAMNIPIVVSDDCPFEPREKIVFPFAQARELTGGRDYLTSSIAYMLAYAILSGATEIGIWGVDLAVDDNEYFYQRPCAEYWMGIAAGRGIKITVPEVSALAKSDVVYGKGYYGDPITHALFNENEFDLLARQHRGRVEQIQQQRNELLMQMNAQSGAAEAYERMSKVARATAAGQAIKSLTHTALIK